MRVADNSVYMWFHIDNTVSEHTMSSVYVTIIHHAELRCNFHGIDVPKLPLSCMK